MVVLVVKFNKIRFSGRDFCFIVLFQIYLTNFLILIIFKAWFQLFKP